LQISHVRIHLVKLGVVYKKDKSFLRSSTAMRGAGLKEDNEKAKEVAGEVKKYLENKNVEVAGEDNLAGCDYILSFGGDGTLIHKASQFAELGIPFIGINTGNIGFLTAVEGKDWQKAADKLVGGEKIFISERMTLDVESVISNKKKAIRHRAVNEAVIKSAYRVCELKIIVNGEEFIKVSGDGVIVATQTGSTGYSLSSGGSIVDPEIDSLIVTFVNPIGLPIPSVVLSPEDEIEIEVARGDDISLIIDGQEHEIMSINQRIKVSRGQYNVKFGYFDKHNFLKSLNAKFGLSNRIVG